MIQIEKGVAIPPMPHRPYSKFEQIPWGTLEIGDSFLWPHNAAFMKRYAKKKGVEILIKRISQTPELYRVWRIKPSTANAKPNEAEKPAGGNA